MGKKILRSLQSAEYEHEFDKKALIALKQTAGFDMLVRQFNKIWSDKVVKIQVTGSYLKVSERNFPEVQKVLEQCCTILDVKDVPSMYICWGDDINAFTAGVEEPIIVINSACVDRLSNEELMFIIGHELGHIKSEHVLYGQMAKYLPMIGEIIGTATLGIGKLLSQALLLALMNWYRMAEFTADRAGLLVCQSIESAATATIKCAGLPQKYANDANIEEFKNQAKEFEDFDYDGLGKVAKLFSSAYNTHPWSVMRAAEMYKWVDKDYKGIVDRDILNDDNHYILCGGCNTKMRVPKMKGTAMITCPTCKLKFEQKL